ncbi:hypothetical protein [Methylomonas koyamae]|nr:hypothetical protein [Methylomonas koyamae]
MPSAIDYRAGVGKFEVRGVSSGSDCAIDVSLQIDYIGICGLRSVFITINKKEGRGMYFLAKLFGILTLVWFYMTAKNQNAPLINWSIIGLVGYWLTWWLAKFFVLEPLSKLVAKHSVMEMVLTQVPVVCAVLACVLIRKKLIASISAN